MLKKHNELHIYIDGSSKSNSKTSSATCACLFLNYCNHILLDWILTGEVLIGTSNRAELAAAVSAIRGVLKAKEKVIIFSDSKYVIRGATCWLNDWRGKNWQTKKGKTIANIDLWKELDSLLEKKRVSWRHVTAHRDCTGNIIADLGCKLCREQGESIEYSGEFKSEHSIYGFMKRKLNGTFLLSRSNSGQLREWDKKVTA